jgi:hypothetical protein
VTSASARRPRGQPTDGRPRHVGSVISSVVEPDELPVIGGVAAKPDRIQTPETPERQESFVLTVSVDEPGQVQRSTIRHTRTGIEDARPGWSPSHLTTFIAHHAGLPISETAAAQNDTRGIHHPSTGPRSVREPVRLHLDAGHLAGGGRRPVRVAVPAPVVPWTVARYEYDLAVTARQLGRRGWRALGLARGRATTGEELVVDIGAADLAPGVHRITLSGHIRPVVPDFLATAGTPVNTGEATA